MSSILSGSFFFFILASCIFLSLATLNVWSFITNIKTILENIFKYPKLRDPKKKKSYHSKLKNRKNFLLKKVILWMPLIHVIVLVLLRYVEACWFVLCKICVKFYEGLYFNSYLLFNLMLILRCLKYKCKRFGLVLNSFFWVFFFFCEFEAVPAPQPTQVAPKKGICPLF